MAFQLYRIILYPLFLHPQFVIYSKVVCVVSLSVSVSSVLFNAVCVASAVENDESTLYFPPMKS